LLVDLDNCINIEEASVDLMTFLVQDLLDFAQIKSGKFRKVLKRFNLR
jgi:signal transduction histidine kinase